AGPKDAAAGNVVMVRRDTGEKLVVSVDQVPQKADELLKAIQKNLLERARAFREANTKDVATHDELLAFFGKEKKAKTAELATDGEDHVGTADATGGFARGLWCGGRECEAELKAALKVTIRNLPFGQQDGCEGGACCLCGKPSKHRAIFARSY
ncbi:MAG TPA: proline--tRNA ligase, partial [Spirochaetales bacterium]|nr:proline--tRNA ligase [Spirochaetales bacterium]